MNQVKASQTAEMSVVGALLMDAKACEALYAAVSPPMFESEALRTVFTACVTLNAAGKPVDVVTVLAQVGASYAGLLQQCAEMVPSISGVLAYAAIVREEWRKRTLQSTLAQLAVECSAPGGCADAIVAQMEKACEAQRVAMSLQEDTAVADFGKAADCFLQSLREPDRTLKSGWMAFDELGCLEPGNTVVLAARPSKGKTDFALNLALKLSMRHKVLFFSMEMPKERLLRRIASNATQINGHRLKRKNITEPERQSILRLFGLMRKQCTIHIDDGDVVTPSMVEGKILQYRPDVIFLDYLQLMQTENKRQTEYERISEITRQLKILAKKHGVVVVMLAQLKREFDRNKGQSAVMADLKGSGSIEQDADVILHIDPEEPTVEVMSGNMTVQMHLRALKMRDDAKRTVEFDWMPQYAKYIPLEYAKETFSSVEPEQPCPFEQTKL